MRITFKKRKKLYFKNINEKDITDNSKFWHTVKPFSSQKKNQGKLLC